MRKTCSAVLCAILASSYAPGQEGKEGAAHLFSDIAPKKWTEYVLLCGHLRGVIRVSRTHEGQKSSLEKEIRQSDGCAFVRSELSSKTFSAGVWATNLTYSFELKKRQQQKKAWNLEGLSEGRRVAVYGIPIREEILSWCAKPLYFLDHKLPSLVTDEKFAVSQIAEVMVAGKKLLRVDFEFPHAIDPQHFTTPVQGGSMHLDPEAYWCITEYTARCQWADGKGTYRIRNNFKRLENGFPVVARVESVLNSSKSAELRTVTTFDLCWPTEPPAEEEFLISQFGFPEPKFSGRKLPLYLWLVVGGIACFVVAFVIRRVRSRVRPPN